MRVNTPGFSVPEQRFAPFPFYWTEQAPEILRWEWLNWPYDARQRKFYQSFCGRSQGSIWENECAFQSEINKIANGSYEDPRAWSMPVIVNNSDGALTGNEYLGQPTAYANYINWGHNARPVNPYTGRAVDTASDPLYVASRLCMGRQAFRFAMYAPSAAELTALDTAHGAASDTYCGIGFEVNSAGSHLIYALELVETGVVCEWRVRAETFGSDGTQETATVQPVTLNVPGAWAWYYLEYDPPVLRFVQPTAGQTDFWTYPDVEAEISLPNLAAQPIIQPMFFNESNHLFSDHATLYLGQWQIWPLTRLANTYKVATRVNPESTCGDFAEIFDTGGRPHLLVYVDSIQTGATYEIEWAGTGADQPATQPEARTWRRIDDNDYTGTTDADSIASVGLFNAARFIRVSLEECNETGTQTIAFTANAGGER